MTSRTKLAARAASRRTVLTLTQRVERLEWHYFAQKSRVTSTTGARFLVRDDVVQDTQTGLMWTRRNVSDKALNWSAAKAACSACRVGGFEDWRLPPIQELLTLVDYSRTSPAIDTSAFKCESGGYWSATPYASSPGEVAWGVSFYSGYSFSYHQGFEFFSRAVRSGQL